MDDPATIIIAGERLTDLEAALDHLDFIEDEHGCLGLAGSLPDHLYGSLTRALKTVEAELDEIGLCLCVGEEWRPLRQLLRRMGDAYNGT